MEISKRLLIAPSFAEITAKPAQRIVRIDPERAFGTGTHPTTKLCLQLLDEQLLRRGPCSVLDVGCGSGILSLAAARLGASEVTGIDTDADAVAAASANAGKNSL